MCMRIKLISIWKASHKDLLWNSQVKYNSEIAYWKEKFLRSLWAAWQLLYPLQPASCTASKSGFNLGRVIRSIVHPFYIWPSLLDVIQHVFVGHKLVVFPLVPWNEITLKWTSPPRHTRWKRNPSQQAWTSCKTFKSLLSDSCVIICIHCINVSAFSSG